MSEHFPSEEPRQNLNISGDASLENVQIGGIAGRDLNVTQIQGQVVYATVYDQIHAPDGLSGKTVITTKPLTQQEYRYRQILLDKVKDFWIRGVLENSLHLKALIELGLEERLDAVKRPFSEVEEFPDSQKRSVPRGTTATNIFEQMGTGRTLLILGEPGSGKTITLLKLAQSLIAKAETDFCQPIPVVFNLSSWASKSQNIADWLVEELRSRYQVSQSFGKTWIEDEQLLLLLDGLDEVKAERRNACVQKLNQFINEHGMTEIVICSRIRDYEVLSERLILRSAIYIQPLTFEQIEQYLNEAGEQLNVLKTLLKQDGELRKLATSPLILSVMSLAYHGCSSEEISSFGIAKEREQQLLDAYIARMFFRRRNQQKYCEEKSRYWLIFLAKQMSNSSKSIFFIEDIQPIWLVNTKKKWAFFFILWIIFGLIFTPFFIPLSPFYDSSGRHDLGGLERALRAILAGAIAGLTIAGYALLRQRIIPIKRLRFSLKRARKITPWVIAFFLFSFPIHLLGWLWDLITNNVVYDLAFRIESILTLIPTVGLIVIFIYSSFHSDVDSTAFPNQGIWESAKSALILSFIGLLLGFSLDFGTSGFPNWRGNILPGLLLGLIRAGYCCIQHLALRILLYFNGNVPWNYALFLDYATEHLFVQKVGGGYVFVHRMLLEHFAQMELQQGIVEKDAAK